MKNISDPRSSAAFKRNVERANSQKAAYAGLDYFVMGIYDRGWRYAVIPDDAELFPDKRSFRQQLEDDRGAVALYWTGGPL